MRTAVQQAGLDYDSAEVSFVPEFTQEVDAPTAEKLMKIIDALEDSDDVQNVYTNFDVPDEVLASHQLTGRMRRRASSVDLRPAIPARYERLFVSDSGPRQQGGPDARARHRSRG